MLKKLMFACALIPGLVQRAQADDLDDMLDYLVAARRSDLAEAERGNAKNQPAAGAAGETASQGEAAKPVKHVKADIPPASNAPAHNKQTARAARADGDKTGWPVASVTAGYRF